jgi:hypothetical protein
MGFVWANEVAILGSWVLGGGEGLFLKAGHKKSGSGFSY